MKKEDKKSSDGLTAYEILDLPDCPIALPHARSMTQASIDFYSTQDRIISWYENYKLTKPEK